ncbi:MAG: 4-hydroxyphenylpyruvate dioxygenase [Candidatus Electryonea clarkiae]|nr:4-hydroxyphenylpyruvate dioxygenase [Candidatus Electryonea clarkiae]MDP8286739.1 4-hydroxyphenylpyruvate dioxygenase [Candidatus Electryonea clarkiae]
MQAPPLPIRSIHHIELLVGNAKQASFYYRNSFGFDQVAYAGPETGNRDMASYLLRQGNMHIILSTPLNPEHPHSEFLKLHGDSVLDIAFEVDNTDTTYKNAIERGALNVREPKITGNDKNGKIKSAAIRTYGDTVHSFIEKGNFSGTFLPGFEPFAIKGKSTGILFPDHIVGNVEDRKMDYWVNWYKSVFGFHKFASFDDKDISTEFSSLRSTVVADQNETIKFPINEPAEGRSKSQIQEYVESYGGAGVQHVAFLTGDIVDTISLLSEQGVEFLEIPDTYYDSLLDRVAPIDEDIDVLRKLGILVDRDDRGYLLQLFTKPVADRPTLFYEIIQRKGCRGFGKGNFKALFESIEREQKRRGNLDL